MGRMEGKIAVVTGVGSGIGQGIAEMWAAEGAKIVGVDFNGASENIARSRTVEHAEAAFLSSSSHRITLMGRQWTRMGVGVATTPEGFVYVVQIFVR